MAHFKQEAEIIADELRGMIKNGRDDDFKEYLQGLVKDVDEDESKLALVRAVIQGQDLEDGKTLLLLAAAEGREKSVTSIVEVMESQVS